MPQTENSKNILFISANRLGDAVLSTGLLAHLHKLYPDAAITVVCGVVPAPLFAAAPQVVQIITLRKEKYNLHWLKLWQKLKQQKWHLIIDLRDSFITRLFRGPRLGVPRSAPFTHKVQELSAVFAKAPLLPPKLYWSAADAAFAAHNIPPVPVLALGPTSQSLGKQWPAERFAQLALRLTAHDGLLPAAPIVILAAKGEDAQIQPLLQALPANQLINLTGRTNPAEAAACLSRCALYVGNDSGLMHIAAAVGIPTLGLYGPSDERVYGAFGVKAHSLRCPESYEMLYASDMTTSPPRSHMLGLAVADVLQAIEQKFAKDLSRNSAAE